MAVKSRKNIVKKLDTVFSQYIRLRYADNYIVECYTCGIKNHYKKMHCGHFMSRKHYSTRWDELNCQVQCYKFSNPDLIEKTKYYESLAKKLL